MQSGKQKGLTSNMPAAMICGMSVSLMRGDNESAYERRRILPRSIAA
jgi:hypothetical protein